MSASLHDLRQGIHCQIDKQTWASVLSFEINIERRFDKIVETAQYASNRDKVSRYPIF